jgi:hypothetical protein
MGGGVCVCLCVYIYLFSTAMGGLGGFLGIFNFHSFKCGKIENFIKRMWQIKIM